MILPSKDPAEIITVTFDYTSEIGAASISASPVIGVSVANGVDADFATMPDGAAQISGALVLQRFRNGVNAVDYNVRCLVTLDDGRKLLRAGTLPVRTAG